MKELSCVMSILSSLVDRNKQEGENILTYIYMEKIIITVKNLNANIKLQLLKKPSATLIKSQYRSNL